MSDVYVSDKDGNRISPGKEDTLLELKDRLDRLLVGLGCDSTDYKEQKLTIDGAGLAQGVPQVCKLVRVSHTNANATYMSINKDGDDADTGSFLLPADVIIGPLPITNTDQLHFYGTAADAVHLLLTI